MSEKKPSRQSDKTSLAPKRSQSGRSKTPSEFEDTLDVKKADTAKSMEKFKKCVETSTKAAAGIRKLRAKGKEEKDIKPKEAEKPTLIWDDTLAGLELGKKRLSVLEREIGAPPRHVRLLPPTPEYTIVTVRKARPKQKKRETFTVMKPVRERDAAVKQMNYYGPRCDVKGQILSHSILGEVEDFVKEAEKRGEFKEILAAQTAQTGPRREMEEVCITFKPSPRVAENPKINEDKALQNWDKEMKGRKLEMKRLAGIVGRPEKQLVMTKTDDYVNVKKGRILLAENNHPDVCFWTLQESLGHKHLRPTLTQQERGIVSTPDLSGDAASVRFQKGALREPFDSPWFSSTYVKEKDEQAGGVIKIYNQMLFEDLEVCGKSVCKQQTSAEPNIDCSPGGDASISDENSDSLKEESFTGPCLKIDSTVLKWEPGCCPDDKVAKTTYILIEGYVDQMATGCINLLNCGTTAIRYHWKKAEMKVIPVPRPRRGPQFYFNSDDGVVLPGDTARIKVNFRSRVPGYFRESLLLGTVPILAAGAQIKFVLRGIAKVKKDFSLEIKGLQELLKEREATTLCSYLVREIVRDSSLKAHLKSLQLCEEVDIPSKEVMFSEENPGLFFHGHTVKKLKMLYDNLTMELTGCSTPDDDNTLSITQLTKLIMRLPEPEIDEETDEADLSYNRKELLLWQLHRDVNVLSFPPIKPYLSPSQHRYIICYQLLQDGTDEMVHLAYNTADCLGLTKLKVKEEPLSTKNDQKGKLKGPSNSAKVKGKKRESPNDSNSSSAVNIKKEKCFSPVYKVRSNKKRNKSALNLYDEKVYNIAYYMVDRTVYKMAGLFENL